MRGLRSTIVLAVVLAGLGAYIYFVTNKKSDTDSASKLEKVFPSLTADKINEMTVKAESGDTTTLKKEGGSWKITMPAAVSADDMAIGGLTSTLTSLEVTRIVDENPSSLNDYGLETPRIEVDFKAEGDKDTRRLLIGEKSPTGGQIFAKRNDDKRVFLIPAFQETTFNKSTFDLRDKAVVKFDREKVDGVELVADGKTVQLGKQGTDWTLVKPVATKADTTVVEGLIGKLQAAQMKAITAENPTPADLKKYGLDKPSATVTLNAGSARATLMLGGKADDTTMYARDASKPVVVTVESTLADDLKKGAGDYRVKDVFQMRAYNTNHIEITRDGQTVVFDMTKGTGDNAQNKWKRTSPNPADVDHDKTEAFLSRLSNLRAASFVDSTASTGLDKPALSVKSTYEDTKHDEATFGRSGKDVYAARPGEPGAAKVDAMEFDEMLKALDEVAK